MEHIGKVKNAVLAAVNLSKVTRINYYHGSKDKKALETDFYQFLLGRIVGRILSSGCQVPNTST